MNRREFLTLGVATTAALAIPSLARAQDRPNNNAIWPAPLKSGDKVALVAPAAPIGKPEDLNDFLERVRALGLEPVQSPNLSKEFGFFGGTDQERADDINWAFQTKEIKGILPIRGGYGCTRMLHLLDYKLIASNPKLLCGYSDITALLIAINQETNLVTFHGPLLASSKSDYADQYFKSFLFGPRGQLSLRNPSPEILDPENPTSPQPDYQLHSIGLTKGSTTGTLTGGNLSLLAPMCGTPFQLDGRGKIVFLEDVREAPYRIDRMLTQLIHAGVFRGAVGIICGQFTNCNPANPEPDEWLVADVLRDRLAPLNIAVISGAAIGHIRHKWTLPIGADCQMDPSGLSVDIKKVGQ